MKKRLTVLIILVFLAACAPQQEEQETRGELTGTEGISVQFMRNTPPPIVYGETELPIMLQVENKGTYSNPKAKIYLSGYDPNIIDIDPNEKEIGNLTGRGPYQPRGDTIIETFEADISDISNMNIDKYSTVFLATNCYEYQTKTGIEICLDFNPYAVGQTDKICTPSDVTLEGGQGAPIAVTQVELEPGRDITRLIIHVRNLGTGTVFKTSAMDQCSPYEGGLSYNDISQIEVEEIRVSGQDITSKCQPGMVPLTDGEGLIFCTIQKNQVTGLQNVQSAFISPLNIKLKYGYRESTTVPIQIKPAS